MYDKINLPRRTITMDGIPAHAGPVTQRTIDSGMIFLVGELEKRDTTLYEPLSSVTWPRDLPVHTGGGPVENVTTFNLNYATSGGNADGIQGKQTNDVPVMQADIGRDSYKVFNWSHILKVPFMEQQLMLKVSRSLDDILDRGIKLAHDKMLDQNAYIGQTDFGTKGLVNSSLVTTATADPHTSGGTDTQWTAKTAQEILRDINNALNATWAASEYDISGMANHILIPPDQFAYINNTPVSSDCAESIITYLLKNNVATAQGIELTVAPCRWCDSAGANSTDRMVCYCNSENRVRFDLTDPLHRVMTQASATEMAYMTPYMSQFSEVEWIYTQHARYVDGI